MNKACVVASNCKKTPCVCACVFFLRKEAEDDEGAEEAAPPCCVCADGRCWRFSEVEGHQSPSRQTSNQEETAACHTPSKHKPLLWLVVVMI